MDKPKKIPFKRDIKDYMEGGNKFMVALSKADKQIRFKGRPTELKYRERLPGDALDDSA